MSPTRGMTARARWLLALVLLLTACGPRPVEPPPSPPPEVPSTPTPVPSAPPEGRAGLAEPGLAVTLTFEGGLEVVREGPPLRLRLPPAAVEPVARAFLESPLFGAGAKPAPAEGKVKLTLVRGDLEQERASGDPPAPEFQDLADRLRALVPRPFAHHPEFFWVAGRLEHEDLEGGTWKLAYGEGEGQSFVLTGVPPEARAGDLVAVTGRPAPEAVGLQMAGPVYEVLSLQGLGSAAPGAGKSPRGGDT